jgi:prepilin-type N-terminal cleavage/methylation domain-containing protein
MHHRPNNQRQAFTLLEMIVVIIVLGIMSSMIIPRLTGTRGREFNLTVDKVADVVLMFAHRVSTSNKPAGLRFNVEAMQFELLQKFEVEGERFWDIDPLAQPVVLPTWLNQDSLAMYVDGELKDTSHWPFTTTPGETRPLVEVVLQWEDRNAIIHLASHAIGPTIWFDGTGIDPLVPVDLDAEGRGREEW